jgi:tRNA(fMet)-specific endonuclease VapC
VDVLIDTSVLIAIERSGARPETLLTSAADRRPYLAAITASELLHGVHRADSAVRRGWRERFVNETLAALPVLAFDLETARVHARLWADLSQRGQTIGAHDLQIAATALLHGLSLATVNQREFRRISGLAVEIWR